MKSLGPVKGHKQGLQKGHKLKKLCPEPSRKRAFQHKKLKNLTIATVFVFFSWHFCTAGVPGSCTHFAPTGEPGRVAEPVDGPPESAAHEMAIRKSYELSQIKWQDTNNKQHIATESLFHVLFLFFTTHASIVS